MNSPGRLLVAHLRYRPRVAPGEESRCFLTCTRELLAVPFDGHDLLEGRPVLPRQERLGDRPERAEVDGVVTGLVAALPGVGADRVGVQLLRVDLQRRA